MRMPLCLLFAATISVVGAAQNRPNEGAQPGPARIFITDSKSWEIAGGGGGSSSAFGGGARGGARPKIAEIIKTLGERCPDAIVYNQQEKADYGVVLDHEGGKGLNPSATTTWRSSIENGDSIVSHSTRSLGNAVRRLRSDHE
jgi:hypothetical protein